MVFDQETSNNIAKVATYNHKDNTSALDLGNFEIIHTNLGLIN